MAVSTRTRMQEMRSVSNNVLKVVHPRGYAEVFREPITAGEIIRRYPRHCIARPDFFEFPWIVVHPGSLLVPGKVFYLVPYRTIHNRLMAKKQQQIHCNDQQISPIKSLAGVTPKHQLKHTDNDHEYSYGNDSQGQDSDSRSLYKVSFYESWNRMQRNLHQESYGYQLEGWRPHVTNHEQRELVRLKSCLRKADSDRKNLNLKVTFASPVVNPWWPERIA